MSPACVTEITRPRALVKVWLGPFFEAVADQAFDEASICFGVENPGVLVECLLEMLTSAAPKPSL